jgi:hypothetical protein
VREPAAIPEPVAEAVELPEVDAAAGGRAVRS